MLVTVAVVTILVSMVMGVATHIDKKDKVRLTESTIALLNAALGQFRDYGYRYELPSPSVVERDFYRSLVFPLDCNGFTQVALEAELAKLLGLSAAILPPGAHDPSYSACEALYFFLDRVPESRKTLGKIDKSLITNAGAGNLPMNITIVTGAPIPKIYPLLRVIDPWGTTLRYDYYPDWPDYSVILTWLEYLDFAGKSKRTFPVIISAGPDRKFGTPDDIISSRM